jgi:hypothetical protein
MKTIVYAVHNCITKKIVHVYSCGRGFSIELSEMTYEFTSLRLARIEAQEIAGVN